MKSEHKNEARNLKIPGFFNQIDMQRLNIQQ